MAVAKYWCRRPPAIEHSMPRRLAFCLLLLSCGAWPLHAAAQDTALDRFLAGLGSWSAEFTQSTTDVRGRSRGREQGRLVVQRPGRFRWETGPTTAAEPAQIMVADGRNLWFFDRDVEQVTVKPANAALTVTPATLLAGTVPLRSAFAISELPRRDGLDWVRVAPLRSDAEFRETRLGFRGFELRRMELDDKLGQKVLIVFERIERNPALADDVFRFQPPTGADLIGTPTP
ncbi:MAG: outer membrane lipoprotein chaperone LolA [Sinobacteraceae bacterium]|nr:outer membrane lipoprotein chaperone LolA [Nevskiaceae bacterium]